MASHVTIPAGVFACRINALFQAVGIASYRHGDRKQLVRAQGGIYRYVNIFRMGVGELSGSDFVTENTFWVGVYPGLTNQHIDYMIEKIREWF